MDKDFFIKNLWFWKCGMPETKIEIKKESSDTLLESEWSREFENLCRNRLAFGALRYGKINEPGKKKYDRISSISKRLNLYKETGNLEHLVDIANLSMLEFIEGEHPLKHFSSIDDGEHVDII